MEEVGYIYYCKNKINGKGYVGQTKRTLQQRQREHLTKEIDTLFSRALFKYGKENFEWEILEQCEYDKLNEREVFWIKEKNTYMENGKGYNMTYGGDSFPPLCNKNNMRPIRVYKIEKSHRIIFYKDYSSITDAANELTKITNKNFRTGDISSICQGKIYSSHGFTFKYLNENNVEIDPLYKGELNICLKNYQKHNQKTAKCIKVIDKEDKVIGIYGSIAETSQKLKVGLNTVSRYLNTNKSPTRGKAKDLLFFETNKEKCDIQIDEPTKITEEIEDKIIQIFSQNKNITHTAWDLDISRESVRRVLRKKGLIK